MTRRTGIFLFVMVLVLSVALGVALRKIHREGKPFNALIHELHRERQAKREVTAYWRDMVAQARMETEAAVVNLVNYQEECREEKRTLTGQLYPQVRNSGW